jgi:hypothetical protein
MKKITIEILVHSDYTESQAKILSDKLSDILEKHLREKECLEFDLLHSTTGNDKPNKSSLQL